MMRILLAGLLATLLATNVRPAVADDASDFFTLFDRTCARSLTDRDRFVEAAKAAGATFKFALSGRSEAEAVRDGHTTYWAMDNRPHGLVVTMTAGGSVTDPQLSCIVYAPPHAGITLDAAITHIRAAMGLGQPTKTTSDGADGKAGASWFLGTGDSQQRIGADIAAVNSDDQASIAVITQVHVKPL